MGGAQKTARLSEVYLSSCEARKGNSYDEVGLRTEQARPEEAMDTMEAIEAGTPCVCGVCTIVAPNGRGRGTCAIYGYGVGVVLLRAGRERHHHTRASRVRTRHAGFCCLLPAAV